MTIWKYQLEPADMQTVPMPEGSRILTVSEQGGRPHIWALVDEHAALEDRCFTVVGTGHIAPRGTYHGTAFCGAFVWHVFEVAAA